MRKYISYITFATFVLLFGFVSAYSQEAATDGGVIKTKDGYLIIKNGDSASFTIEFKGATFKAIESDHPVFTIDEKLWQIVDVSSDEFKTATEKLKTFTDEETLELHKKQESDYIGKAINAKLAVSSETIDLDGKRKALIWSFPMPKEIESDFSHQIFLTTVIGKRVLAVNASVDAGKDFAAYKKALIETIKTLKISDKPFDMKKISADLKSQTK